MFAPSAIVRGLGAGSLLTLLVGFGHGVTAQVLNFTSYAHAQGLPQVQVTALLQDTHGFIWVGTYGGLSRYDGREFRTLTSRDGLSANRVVDLVALPGGAIIAATVGGGICFVTPGAVSCLRAADGLAGDIVNDLHLDDDGSLWVATESGLSEVRDRSVVRTYGPEDGLPSTVVRRVLRSTSGSIWVSTNAGTATLTGGRFESHDAESGRGADISLMHFAADGVYTSGTDGLLLHHGDAFESIDVPGGEPVIATDAANDAQGGVWFATRHGAVYVREGRATRLTTRNGLLSDVVERVLVDREGSIWFGTESGLSKLVPGPLSLWTTADGLPNSTVRALAEDAEGRVWMGTRDGVAVFADGTFTTEPLPNGITDPRVYSMARAPEGGMLVGTRDGLVHYGPAGARLLDETAGLPDPYVSSLLADKGGVWVGTAAGVVRLESDRVVPAGLPQLDHDFVVTMARDAAGRIWFGRRSGGAWVLDGDSLKSLGLQDGLTDQTVWSLAADREGRMWVGSNGDGVFRVDGSSVVQMTTREGLVNDFVWQVLPDSRGAMWFFTTNGLDRWSGGTFTHYGRGDGLVDPEGSATAALEDSSGRLWFGSASGVYLLDPSRAPGPGPAPPIFVEEITAAGRSFPADGAMIPPRSGGMSIRFVSPSFRDESAVRFRYRLPGVSSEWSAPESESVLRVAALGPGRHTFEVLAVAADGSESAAPARVTFTVLPSFWQAWWFRLMGVLVAIGASAAVLHVRARRAELERIRLEGLVRERTAELADRTDRLQREMEERTAAVDALRATEDRLHEAQRMEAVGRLAGGIAHDFNNLLTAVIGNVELMASDLGDDDQHQEDLMDIRDAATRGAAMVAQLLALGGRQIVTHELIDVNQAVSSSVRLRDWRIGEQVSVELSVEPEPALVRMARNHLDQVLLNLAANAVDAMPHGGLLSVSIRRTSLDAPLAELGPDEIPPGSYIRLRVTDTGTGMDEHTLDRIFEPFFTTKEAARGAGLGLSTLYGMVHQSGGFVQVRSQLDQGTEFSVYLPEVAAPEALPEAGLTVP